MSDPMTGLHSRRWLQSFFETNDPDGWNVAEMDIDNFQLVNHVSGHYVGDDFLVEIAAHLQETFASGHVVRIGGDEFLLLTEMLMPDLLGRLEEVQQRLALFTYDTETWMLEHHPGAGALSGTVGICTSAEERTWEQMLLTADRRMYLGKKAGRSRVVTAG